MMVRHCGNCGWYMPLAAGSGVCFADGVDADYKDYWDKACCGWRKNIEEEKRMTCVQAQRMAQIEAQLAALEKKVAFQEALLQEQDVALHGLRDGCAERSRTLDSLKDWTETRLGDLKDGFDDLDKRLGAIIDTLSDLTEKMLKELESWEQEKSGIDDGNGTTLASAPAEGD